MVDGCGSERSTSVERITLGGGPDGEHRGLERAVRRQRQMSIVWGSKNTQGGPEVANRAQEKEVCAGRRVALVWRSKNTQGGRK